MPFCFLSPRIFTGGSLAMHQAAATMNALGGAASVLYPGRAEKRAGTAAFQLSAGRVGKRRGLSLRRPDVRLRRFGVPVVRSAPSETHFVLPEIWPKMAAALLSRGCPNVWFWWLSVDNFPGAAADDPVLLDALRRRGHLCQSHHAAEFAAALGASDIAMLSDFVEIGEVPPEKPFSARAHDIAYVPAKARWAAPVLEALAHDFTVLPLEGLSRAEVERALADTRIFLDFGPQGGKDRVPREAALSGAIPVVRRVGAATDPRDVPLPEPLLIDPDLFDDPGTLSGRLRQILDSADALAPALDAYRARIRGERAVFEDEIRRLIAHDRA